MGRGQRTATKMTGPCAPRAWMAASTARTAPPRRGESAPGCHPGRETELGTTASLLLPPCWFISKAVLHLMVGEDQLDQMVQVTLQLLLHQLFKDQKCIYLLFIPTTLEVVQGFSKSRVNDGRSCDGEGKAPLQRVHYSWDPCVSDF